METFTAPKALVANPSYQAQRKKSLTRLRNGMIDEPIVELINSFNKLPYCFTLQSCYGHFVYNRQTDPRNFARLNSGGMNSSLSSRSYLASGSGKINAADQLSQPWCRNLLWYYLVGIYSQIIFQIV